MKIFPALVLCSGLAASAFAESPSPSPTPAETPIQLQLDSSFAQNLRIAEPTPGETQGRVKPDIHYVPTPQQLVDVMLLMADVKKGELLYDLGSGDGRLVITAAKNHGARGIGIDIDPERIAEAKNNAAAAGVEDKVEFRQADLFKSNFSDANVVTLYLLNELNVRLRPQLFRQLRPGTRIVSHAFNMGDWDADQDRTVKIKGSEYNAYFWMMPANMSGRWKVSGGKNRKGLPETVVVEQTFQRFSVRGDAGGEPIGEGRVHGTEFNLTLRGAGGGGGLEFTGTIEGNTIKASGSGKAGNWTAEREAGTEKPIDPDLR